MTSSSRLSMVALGVAYFFAIGSVYGQTSNLPASVEIVPSIREKIENVLPKTSPDAVLRRVKGVVESGGATPAADRYFERLDNGLWGVTFVVSVRGAIIRRALTLQGLIPLSTVTEIAREYDASSVLPIGKSFFSYTVVRDLKANGSTNSTALSGDLAQLAAPLSGSKFSFEHAWDAQSIVTTSGLFGGTRTANLSLGLKQTCTVEMEKDAVSLHTNLRGKYLPVNCEGKLSNGSSRSDQYAFLVDSGLYVLLSTSTDGRTDKYTMTEIEYVK